MSKTIITGDEPYYPIQRSFPAVIPKTKLMDDTFYDGITIRQKLAADNLVALMANPNFNGGEALNTVADKVKSAIAHADDLIKALNETTNPNLPKS